MAPDAGSAAFISTALCLEDLGMTDFSITPVFGAALKKRMMTEASQKFRGLRALRLKSSVGMEELGPNYMMKDLFPALQEIEISYPLKSSEQWLGLKKLESLSLTFSPDDDSEEDLVESEERALTQMDHSIAILRHYLPAVKILWIRWEGCTCCISESFNRKINTTFSETPVRSTPCTFRAKNSVY